MDKTPLLSNAGMNQKVIPCMPYFNMLGIPFIIGLLYALLGVEKNDCEIGSQWLYLEFIVQVIITAASISQIAKRMISKSGSLVKVPLLLVALFQITWLIMGFTWIFDEELCLTDYPETIIMIALISVVNFIFIIVFLILYIITAIVEAKKKKR
ncbi:hypothetical protein SteCoe_33154 [Stentor coeruleus]|uniref:Uncharacterized protein n=1 Tax=Stentor coeruleus TaxID=5963 RepID=A0A1R2AXE2_9CILI|nr:hypothetical protein SteCoe_33154 [Stentor coeruleus]